MLECPVQDLDTDLLVFTIELQVGERSLRTEQRNTTTRDDTLFDRRTRSMQGILDESLLLFHLGLGRGTHVDDRNTTGELREALLELLTVVVRRALVDRDTDLIDPALDVVGFTGTIDDDRVVLVDDDTLRRAQVAGDRVLELEADFLGNHLAAGQDRNVLEHGLAAIAEARRLDRGNLERTAELVHDERRERLTFHVLGHDQERAARLSNLLEDRQHVLHRADLLVVNEDHRILENRFHPLRIRHEVRGEIAAVELHAVDGVQCRLEATSLFDRDDTVLADLLHCVGNQLTDLGVVVRRNRTNLRNVLLVLGLRGERVKLSHDGLHALVDPAADTHRVRTGGDVLEAFTEDGLGQHRSGRGTVTGDVGRLGGDFLDHLGTHVLHGVFQFDLLGDGHAVLGHRGGSELPVQDHIPALRAEGHLHSGSKLVNANLKTRTRLDVEIELFC